MKNRLKQILVVLIATFGISSVSYASIITVGYQATNVGYEDLSGSFTGEDVNNDGWLVFDELTDWFTNYDNGATFAALNDLGDFNYQSNTWIPNALQWNQQTEDAYMTWNNWGFSASTSNYNWVFTTDIEGSNPVPEPSTIFLLGFGLLGMTFYRKKKA